MLCAYGTRTYNKPCSQEGRKPERITNRILHLIRIVYYLFSRIRTKKNKRNKKKKKERKKKNKNMTDNDKKLMTEATGKKNENSS